MGWLQYPILRLLIALISGVILQRYCAFNTAFLFALLTLSFITMVVCLVIKTGIKIRKLVYGIAALMLFFTIGYGNSILRSAEFQRQHYTHFPVNRDGLITLSLEQQLPFNGFSQRYYATVKSIDTAAVSGKVLYQVPVTDSLALTTGTDIVIYSCIRPIAVEKNPSDFNYKSYLEGIDVYGRIYGGKSTLLDIRKTSITQSPFIKARNNVTSLLAATQLESQPLAFIEALLLGQREHLDPAISADFRDAGVIHILALSGLHVGILLLILQTATRWLRRFKNGLWIQATTVVTLLWLFGFLTGMSPSIMRAITMFTFVAIGMNIKRKTGVLNSLAFSAFVLLIVNPKLLFQVGFQLSYIAVFAIVMIQPIIARLWRPRYWLVRYLWSVFTVTLAAQIGVAPLSIFYFHQFPGLFLVGNMLLLPVMPMILGLAILFIVLVLSGIESGWLAHLLNVIFNFYIEVMAWIGSFKSFVFTDLYLDFSQLLLIYGIILALVLFFRKTVRASRKERATILKPNYGLHIAMLFTIVLICMQAFTSQSQDRQIVVMHQNIGTAVAVIQDNDAVLLTDLHVLDRDNSMKSKQRLRTSTLFTKRTVQEDSIQPLITLGSKKLMVVGANGLYATVNTRPAILLSHSPKVNLDRVINDLKPSQIIADGSNYEYSIAQWQLTCKKLNVPFHNTYEDGAVVVK